ncbi:Retrovirus-related Pol polyprotein from transposon TNT 1-94 [Senna tora]|uniref:Retrovirus-related Pol polyprotein from transposon TNT 1-94 n=1 Tax=Senna tora TaxID=362788 RepID=A0A834SX59_9FABA|nr:Retrovirus-related Pol polyprotein from transposon TNT 1-94 [Senna tora]
MVPHILNSLPSEFTQIKTAFNTGDTTWSVNDLITKCVAEEEKLKSEKGEVALLSHHYKSHPSKSSSGKKHEKSRKNSSVVTPQKHKILRNKAVTLVRTKMWEMRSRVKEKSFLLWHKRLGHISRDRIERLIKNDVLPSLDLRIWDPVWIVAGTDARSFRCSFIRYPERAKGYRFYCSGRGGKIVESLNARFLELDVTDVSDNVEPIYQTDSTHQNDSIAISMPASEEVVVPSAIITIDVQEVVPQEYQDPSLIADRSDLFLSEDLKDREDELYLVTMLFIWGKVIMI